MTQPRMRMFAGPNGSGKSTLRDLMLPQWVGVYINPDELESHIRDDGYLDFGRYSVQPESAMIRNFLQDSVLLERENLARDMDRLSLRENRLHFSGVAVNAYHASVLADLIRAELLRAGKNFTFETVMSSPAKVQLMNDARSKGYRVYLYYIATEDPQINLSRVANRVRMGGHDVPSEKVVSRYARSLDLLHDAILASHRAYIFDNSGDQQAKTLLAEFEDGHDLVLITDVVPAWFQIAVVDKFH